MPQNRLFLFLAFIPVIIKANIPTLRLKYLISLFCDSNPMPARFDCSGVKIRDGAVVMAGLQSPLKSLIASAGLCNERLNTRKAMPRSCWLIISGVVPMVLFASHLIGERRSWGTALAIKYL